MTIKVDFTTAYVFYFYDVIIPPSLLEFRGVQIHLQIGRAILLNKFVMRSLEALLVNDSTCEAN